MLEDCGFTDVQVGPPVRTFAGAPGEGNAEAYGVRGHAFLAHRER